MKTDKKLSTDETILHVLSLYIIGNLYVNARAHLVADIEPCVGIFELCWALGNHILIYETIRNNIEKHESYHTTYETILRNLAFYELINDIIVHNVQYGFIC